MFPRHARVWNHKEKKFEYTDMFDLSLGTVCSRRTGHVYHRSQIPVMDFTGLHDKDGHSVWVEDLLKSPKGRIYTVKQDPVKGFVGVCRDNFFRKIIRSLDFLLLEGCLKVGNNYDLLRA